jgi:hypothetical protein
LCGAVVLLVCARSGVVVWWWWVVVVVWLIASSPSTAAAAIAWTVYTRCTSSIRALGACDEGGVYNPCSYADEGHPKQCPGHLLGKRSRAVSTAVFIVSTPPSAVSALAIFLVTFLREHESVLDAATALQNVGVFRVIVALANNVRGTELEFLGE